MCYDLDSRPPIEPIAGGAHDGEPITLRSEDGTEFMGRCTQRVVRRERLLGLKHHPERRLIDDPVGRLS